MVKRNLDKFNLKIDAPELCLEWNYNKNELLLPEAFYKSSHTKVWWICSKSHEWKASIHARSMSGTGCPYCANKKACADNCLATLYPQIALEWNYIKNDLMPNDVLPNTKKKVWWACSNNHEWKAWIGDRVAGTKCTQCAYGYVVRDRKDIYSDDGSKKYCKICNKLLDLSFFRIKGNNQKGYWENNTCKDCDSNLVKDYRLTDKGIAADIVRRTKYVSKKKSIPFDLDKEWALDRLNKIDWKCELTGMPMQKRRDNLEHRGTGFQWNSISIDKIMPNKGYVKSNVRFVLNQLNVFRQDGDDDRMYMLAEALLRNKNEEVQGNCL
jgi:hypothetical protein